MMEKHYKTIADNICLIKSNIQNICNENKIDSSSIILMAVTKTVPSDCVNIAIEQGVHLLGENKVQEFLSKKDDYEMTSEKIHFIGHLQTNKVKNLIGQVSMIESVSSVKLAKEINKCCGNASTKIDILLQINIGEEDSKSGFLINEIESAIVEISKMENVQIKGLMCIPPKIETEKYFIQIHQLFVDIKSKKMDNVCMDFLSMGMSSDYALAIKHGANIVRLGSAIFGFRIY